MMYKTDTISKDLMNKMEFWVNLLKESDKGNNIGVLWSLQYRSGISQKRLKEILDETEVLLNEVRTTHG